MDETHENQSGPTLSGDALEIQGRFPSDVTMQDALGRLTLLGFDHADFSLPDVTHPGSTPDSAPAATDEIDKTQVRTMASGLTGAAAGTAVAGVLIATGGLAAPLVAAAAGASAIGAMAATSGAGIAVDQANVGERNRLGREGRLVLAVRVRDASKAAAASAAMQEAGATEIRSIERAEDALTRGVSAASWTGS